MVIPTVLWLRAVIFLAPVLFAPKLSSDCVATRIGANAFKAGGHLDKLFTHIELDVCFNSEFRSEEGIHYLHGHDVMLPGLKGRCLCRG